MPTAPHADDAPEIDAPIRINLDPRVLGALKRELLLWYRAHRRELPWRSGEPLHPTPYHVLVSEAMLQQTQVATVVPYFLRFIEKFPDIQALADADEQDVLHQWQGLGYYRRARNLHEAAQKIVADFGGKIPDNTVDLLTLPGVGRYTAGAIASIAYGRPAPILDGNVARILARLFAIERSIDERPVIAELWRIARHLVEHDAPADLEKSDAGDFNQSMMELGARVCTPTNPQCDKCPVSSWCEARSRRLTDDIPLRTEKRKPLEVEHHIVAIQRIATADAGVPSLLWEQRPSEGLWSKMWQMPTLELEAEDKPHREADIRKWLIGELRLRVGRLRKVGSFKHQTTHRTITFTLWHTSVEGTHAGVGTATLGIQRTTRALLKTARNWHPLGPVEQLPLANPQKTAIRMLLADLAKDK